MRHGRTTFTIALLATITATTAAPAAFADSGVSAGAESSAAAVESSKPTNDTSAPAPAPATESVAPAPAPAPATTSAPQTVTAPMTVSPVVQPVPATPEAPAVPEKPVRDRPATPVDVPGEQPRPGGGTELPFTGPGDVLLAVLIALLAGSGGILLLAGAAGREEIDGLNRRTLASPSGFRLAYRDLLKQQIGG